MLYDEDPEDHYVRQAIQADKPQPGQHFPIGLVSLTEFRINLPEAVLNPKAKQAVTKREYSKEEIEQLLQKEYPQ